MLAQIIFARKDRCEPIKDLFGLWLEGNNSTRLLLIEDNNAPQLPELTVDGNALLLAFRLHASGACNHKTQRDAVLRLCRGAQELPSFSHGGKTGVHANILELSASTDRGAQVQRIVEGSSKEVILRHADRLAAYLALEIILGKEPQGLIHEEDVLKTALQSAPMFTQHIPCDRLPFDIAKLQAIALGCLQ